MTTLTKRKKKPEIGVIVDASEVPKKISERVLELKPGEAVIMDKKHRATIISTAQYWRKYKGMPELKIVTRNLDDERIYVMRIS